MRIVFGAGTAGGSALLLRRASSFPDAGDPPLSVTVQQGVVVANTSAGCPSCATIEARLLAAEGSTSVLRVPVHTQITLVSDRSWTQRGLLLRFLRRDGAVGGVLLVSFPNGNFAAS
jgi:hypothetical protein